MKSKHKNIASFIKSCIAVSLALSIFACTTSQTPAVCCSSTKYVTVEDIQASLPASPIVVGFDIDDTILFSSPGFYYGANNQDGPNGTNIYGTEPLSSTQFWKDMNGQFDNFSIPKKSGGALLQMHYQRGDKIVIISARDSVNGAHVAKVLAQAFGIPNLEVVFTSNAPKASFIKEKGVTLYYGDADSDITEARKAAAKAIRVMRSQQSTNTSSPYHPGEYGEEVLASSEN